MDMKGEPKVKGSHWEGGHNLVSWRGQGSVLRTEVSLEWRKLRAQEELEESVD